MVLRREREAWTEVQTFAQQRRAMYEPGIRDTENWQVWGVCVWGQVMVLDHSNEGRFPGSPSGVRNTIM